MNPKLRTILVLGSVVAIWLLPTSFFAVHQTEIGIVTRFGRPRPGVAEPGLHMKAPWPIDRVVRIDARLLLFDNEPSEMLTLDRKNVIIDSFMCWRVDDPLRFTQTVQSRVHAEARLLDLMSSSLGAAVGQEPMESFINLDAAAVRLAAISGAVADEINVLATESYGIRVENVTINGFNFPPQNRASVIERMRAERSRIATAYRSEGEEEALKIEANADAEKERILAEALAKAEETRGRAEAEALALFAESYRKDPEFYRFLRKLESYERMIDEETTIVIEADAQLTEAFRER
ncbi:MAG: protease modulator HflC [bacterium]|nr:protease modulator HflC [bacterium]